MDGAGLTCAKEPDVPAVARQQRTPATAVAAARAAAVAPRRAA
ncbi:hypothetical protein [Frankia nepalensis]|nr:hypothetical protein [Frankia nepalensis]